MILNNKNLDISNNFSSKKIEEKKSKKKLAYIKKVFDETITNIDKKKDSLYLLSKKFKINFNPKQIKNYQKYKVVVLIGMGGSILGAKAIYNYFENKIRKKFIFVDNLDEKKIIELRKLNFKNVLFIFISKSGNTLETLTNINLIFKPKHNFRNTIIVTERKNNSLFYLKSKL